MLEKILQEVKDGKIPVTDANFLINESIKETLSINAQFRDTCLVESIISKLNKKEENVEE